MINNDAAGLTSSFTPAPKPTPPVLTVTSSGACQQDEGDMLVEALERLTQRMLAGVPTDTEEQRLGAATFTIKLQQAFWTGAHTERTRAELAAQVANAGATHRV